MLGLEIHISVSQKLLETISLTAIFPYLKAYNQRKYGRCGDLSALESIYLLPHHDFTDQLTMTLLVNILVSPLNLCAFHSYLGHFPIPLRILWFLLVIGAAVQITYQVADRISYYIEYPSNVNVEVSNSHLITQWVETAWN